MKTTSLLRLLEDLGADEIKAFTTRSETTIRKMFLLIAEVIKDKIMSKVKQSNGFGLLTDEVTDIANLCQLVTFIQYYDGDIGDCLTTFVDTADVLEHSPDSSPNALAIFNCLNNFLKKAGLELDQLKGFASDGASVMTGKQEGVAAKFKSLDKCKTMISIHCICHRLALACSDTGDELKFIQNFEKTLLDLWKFFKNSPKRLKVYIKVTLEVKTFDTMSKKQKKKLVKKVKKACRTRWLSLYASVDSVYEEYVGLVHALRSMKDDRKSGPIATGLLKKMDCIDFLGVLYLLKFMLPNLSALSRTFQTGSLNFSRIIPSIEKTKAKLKDVAFKDIVTNELAKDLDDRIKLCNLSLTEGNAGKIRQRVKKYVDSICNNIDERFPSDSLQILDSFSIFNVEQMPSDVQCAEFKLYGCNEIEAIGQHYFKDDEALSGKLLEQWKDMRFELLQLKKKWMLLKQNLKENKLELKQTATEWILRQIMKNYENEETFNMICDVAKVALVTPITNAWPERGASAVKRVKTRSRSTMKNDMLNALLMITVNGPQCHTEEWEKLMQEVTLKYEKQHHKKQPNIFIPIVKQKNVSTFTQTIIDDNLENIHSEIEMIEKKLESTFNNKEIISTNAIDSSDDEEDSDEEDNDEEDNDDENNIGEGSDEGNSDEESNDKEEDWEHESVTKWNDNDVDFESEFQLSYK